MGWRLGDDRAAERGGEHRIACVGTDVDHRRGLMLGCAAGAEQPEDVPRPSPRLSGELEAARREGEIGGRRLARPRPARDDLLAEGVARVRHRGGVRRAWARRGGVRRARRCGREVEAVEGLTSARARAVARGGAACGGLIPNPNPSVVVVVACGGGGGGGGGACMAVHAEGHKQLTSKPITHQQIPDQKQSTLMPTQVLPEAHTASRRPLPTADRAWLPPRAHCPSHRPPARESLYRLAMNG